MNHQEARERLGRRLQTLRTGRALTQEQLAEAIAKSTEHISFLERGERSPSFETLLDLARILDTTAAELLDEAAVPSDALIEALEVAPPADPLPEPAKQTHAVQEQRLSDLERLNAAMQGLREMQRLADEYGIHDILQDNGGKVLQVLILLGLKISPGREGNDALDADGNEYELKTVNLALNPKAGITTHHHLNTDIIQKYRSVRAWYIAIYSGIELKEIYRVLPAELESIFQQWEQKIGVTGKELNNPKIPMRLVRAAQRVYPKPESNPPDSLAAP
jgi:transcriptional regulator with XRE-family HTH domain